MSVNEGVISSPLETSGAIGTAVTHEPGSAHGNQHGTQLSPSPSLVMPTRQLLANATVKHPSDPILPTQSRSAGQDEDKKGHDIGEQQARNDTHPLQSQIPNHPAKSHTGSPPYPPYGVSSQSPKATSGSRGAPEEIQKPPSYERRGPQPATVDNTGTKRVHLRSQNKQENEAVHEAVYDTQGRRWTRKVHMDGLPVSPPLTIKSSRSIPLKTRDSPSISFETEEWSGTEWSAEEYSHEESDYGHPPSNPTKPTLHTQARHDDSRTASGAGYRNPTYQTPTNYQSLNSQWLHPPPMFKQNYGADSRATAVWSAPFTPLGRRSENNGTNQELSMTIREMEDQLAEKDEIIKTYRVRELETEILHRASQRIEQAQTKEAQTLQVQEVKQTKQEEQNLELIRLEHENKLRQAVQEAKEQTEKRLKDEEHLRKAEEERIKSMEIVMRRQIESEMAEAEQRKNIEAERRIYLEREIRAQIMAERQEQEEMTLKEELRRLRIERQLSNEFEQKRYKAEERQPSKRSIETNLEVEAKRIIGSEKRQLDTEKLILKIQQGIREILQNEGTTSIRNGSIQKDDNFEHDRSSVNLDRNQAYTQHMHQVNTQGYPRPQHHNTQNHTTEPVASRLSQPRSVFNIPSPTFRSLQQQKTAYGRPESGYVHLHNTNTNRHTYDPNYNRNAARGNSETFKRIPTDTASMERQAVHDREDVTYPFTPIHYSNHRPGQHFHMPIPTSQLNPSNVIQAITPTQAPSSLSSDFNTMRHANHHANHHASHYVTATISDREQEGSNSRPELRSTIGSYIQPYNKSDSSSGDSRAFGDSDRTRAQAVQGYGTSATPDYSPLVPIEQRGSSHLVASPADSSRSPRFAPPAAVNSLHDSVQHKLGPPYDYGKQAELDQENDHPSLVMPQHIVPVSPEEPDWFYSQHGSPQSSGTKERQLRRMKKFSGGDMN